MGKDRLITLVNGYDDAFEVDLICAFEVLSLASKYIIYTKNEKDNVGNSIIYASKIIAKGNKQYLFNIDGIHEWEIVKEKMKEMAKYSYDNDNSSSTLNLANLKKLSIPKSLFANLDDYKYGDEDIQEDEDIIYSNYVNKREYRNKIKGLYDKLDGIRPIDSEINDVMYFDNYMEKGIVIKSSISSMKQLWIEYELIFNEYNKKDLVVSRNEKLETSIPIVIGLDDEEDEESVLTKEVETGKFDIGSFDMESNFDELFSSLSKRVSSINEYLDELKELQNDINSSSTLIATEKDGIQKEKEKLEEERRQFEEYRRIEKQRLATRKNELQDRVNKFQVLVEQLDKKFKEVE